MQRPEVSPSFKEIKGYDKLQVERVLLILPTGVRLKKFKNPCSIDVAISDLVQDKY